MSGLVLRLGVHDLNHFFNSIHCVGVFREGQRRDLKGLTTGKELCSCADCVKNAVLAYGEVMGLE